MKIPAPILNNPNKDIDHERDLVQYCLLIDNTRFT